MPVTQHALTVVAPIRVEARPGLAERLSAREADVIAALRSVSTLHFARFVLLDGPQGNRSRLAFESNHDGERGPHLAELARALAPFEELLFGSWEGYVAGELASFVDGHAFEAATFYLGHPGLTVDQIRNDRDLREHLELRLDGIALADKSARDVRALLLDGLGSTGPAIGPIDRGLPAQPLATLKFYAIVAGVALLVPFALPITLLVERRERKSEPAPDLVSEDDPKLDPINRREDAQPMNGLTHHVPLRAGRYRKATIRVVLWVIEQARRHVAYKGTLGGITSIHFARWVVLDDETVLFFSNYDGSWEAYLGDFIDDAAKYLTAVWSNTKWFPETTALVFGGASKELAFKRWTRTYQVENQIWYSAYPDLTVSNVLQNALIREGCTGEMSDRDARAWLALL